MEHLRRWRGPHRAAHRQDVEIEKVLPVAAFAGEVAQRHALEARIIHRGEAVRIEAVDLENEAPESRAEQILPLPKDLSQATAIPLIAAALVRHAEGHVRLLRLDAKFIKQPAQQRVGVVIEHHETRVDRHLARVLRHRDRIRMPADVARGLEDRQVILPMQKVSTA